MKATKAQLKAYWKAHNARVKVVLRQRKAVISVSVYGGIKKIEEIEETLEDYLSSSQKISLGLYVSPTEKLRIAREKYYLTLDEIKVRDS